MKKQKNVIVVGELHELFLDYLENITDIPNVISARVQNDLSLGNAIADLGSRYMTGFVDYLNSNDYLLQFYANSSDSHGLIPDNSYKFTDVRNVMPGVRSSDIVSDGNRNTLLIPGQDPLNPGEAAISVNYFSKNRIRFAGNLTDVKSGDNHTELLYGNYILNHMCRVVVLSSDKIFHVRSLSDKLNECKSKKTELLNEIQKLDSKIESYSWVLDYMSQNKIIKESKSLVKAKMLLASIKEDEADDNKLTNITELFELSI